MKRKDMNYCFQQADKVHKIYLYDDVTKYGTFNWETWSVDESETSANHFKELLEDIPAEDEIELHINSYGGEVDQGTTIYNLLKEHPAHKTGIVDGVCYSIAFTIFQACDKRIMGDGTSALIHDMSMGVFGNAQELRDAADSLDVLMESCIALFMKRAKGITEDELREMMHAETILTPQMAVDYGFCDEIGVEAEPIEPTEDLMEALKNENKDLKQQLQRRTEFQESVSKFCQKARETKIEQKKPVEASTGFGAFFNEKN